MDHEQKVGAHIIFFDTHRVPHSALVTVWWNNGQPELHKTPALNLVYVSDDEAKTDTYGRQLERATSVSHKSAHIAGGYVWCWPDEV